MSIRRGGVTKDAVKNDELVPFGESLDKPSGPLSMNRDGTDAATSSKPKPGSAPLSLDDRYEAEQQSLKVQAWKENPFAVGLTEPTWADEYAKYRQNPKQECLDTTDHDGLPCICCSAAVCSWVGAGRVGNMAVLKQSTEWVEEVDDPGDGSEPTVRRVKRPKLDILVGPYWPMLFCVTYPLILGLSGVTLFTAIPSKPLVIQIVWAVCTLGLIAALAGAGFRDPGILLRHAKPPPQSENNWRWSDRAHTYRPRGAFYDPDTAVIVEGFDHTCPWVGTAIGDKNMNAFRCFVALVFVCLMFDIILLTNGIR